LNPDLALMFWSLVLFQAKHFVCDFVLQTPYQKRNKGTYGHPGGLLHAGLHGVGSLPAIVLLTRAPEMIGAIVAAEAVAHYHIDWLKMAIIKRRALSFDDMRYRIVFGADQFLHQMGYVIILAVLMRAAA
jgi:hypothetical protein